VLLAVETILLVGVGTPGPVSWWLLGVMSSQVVQPADGWQATEC
jgi:hypothetical protein